MLEGSIRTVPQIGLGNVAKQRLFISLLAATALSGCTGVAGPGSSPGGASDFGQRADRDYSSRAIASADTRIYGDVFEVGYQQIRDIYFRDVDLEMLTFDGISGLSDLDDQISADRHNGSIRVRVGDEQVGDYTTTRTQSPHDWARVTTNAIDALRTASLDLRDASANEIYSAVFSAITDDLDPYSRYVDPNQARDERARRDGYGGIGVVLDLDDEDRPLAREIFPDSPADRAGVIAGSRFVSVDGRPVEDIELDALGDALRGRVNTSVRVRMALPDGGERDYTLRRAQVIPTVVESSIDQDILVLKVSRFNAATAAQIADSVLAGMRNLGPSAKGVILDLRGNPGGLLDQSITVADMFLPQGEIIQTRGRHPNSFQYYPAESNDILAGLPMVVLVDGRSASGAEVVAAALQDSGRAVVIGASSFGKGSVQTVTRLPNDGELFLTWSEIYTPLGYTLNRQGVLPTICTAGADPDADEILDRFRRGELAAPASLATWRMEASTDRQALDRLRNLCPWRSQDGTIDLALAKLLLLDSDLYEQALGTNMSVVREVGWGATQTVDAPSQ